MRGKAKLWLVVGLLLSALGGCGGDSAPADPPKIWSDPRLADAKQSDLDRLRELAGDNVIGEETVTSGDGEPDAETRIAVYLSAADVGKTPVDDATLALVARIPNVARLYLTGTNVTDAGMAEIAKMQSLESINLDGTKITDAGLQRLAELPNLKTVFCRETQVTVAGAAKLRSEKGILITH